MKSLATIPAYVFLRISTTFISFWFAVLSLGMRCTYDGMSYPVSRLQTPQVWLQFLRFTLHSSGEKNLNVASNVAFCSCFDTMPAFSSFSHFFLFLSFSLSLFELKARYSKITETGFRDYLVAGTEKTMETSDCVRETRRRLARQLSVPGTRNVRVEGNEFSRFCWWPVFSVARLEKTGPRTTRKLFTAHLSRPRSRCTNHVLAGNCENPTQPLPNMYTVARVL